MHTREPSVSQSYRAVFDQALCHASLLVERLLFYNRNLGLLPRTSTTDDPLGPIVVSDEDVATIFAGFRKISRTEARLRGQLLADPLGAEIAASREALVATLKDSDARGLGFVEIVHALGLIDTALDPFVLAIAPEWDARLGRLFGFLNNDTTRQRPTFGNLQLTLQAGFPTVSVEAIEKIERHLLRPGLIEVDAATDTPQPGQVVRVPDHIVEMSRAVLRRDLDGTRLGWDRLYWAAEDKAALASALSREIGRRPEHRRLIVIEGTPGSGRSAAAQASAHALGLGCVSCRLGLEPAPRLEREVAASLFRAKISDALLVVRSDGVLGSQPELWRKLTQLASALSVRCAVLVRPDEPLPVDSTVRFVRLTMPRLRPVERRRLWEEVLAAAELHALPAVLDDLSTRFDITPGRLHDLVAELPLRRGAATEAVTVHEVSDALRDITVQKLKDQAALYVADLTLDDLIVEPSVRDRLDELVHRMRRRYEVMDGWRFGGRSMRGYGLSALFAGPPGTGKTAAAGAVAAALEIDLYIVDLSRVMSKWIGETEQNLARIFDEAEASSVALLFDEADSLFGKRSSDVKSGTDRFANITVNYLLQRIERYSGLAILTTNLESAIDTAFSRRITSRVYFASPDEEYRRKLWKQLLPPGVAYARDVDLSEIVRLLDMPGARIRSALMRAAFRAAASGRRQRVLTQNDIYWAAILEYEDMGRLPPINALGSGVPEPALAASKPPASPGVERLPPPSRLAKPRAPSQRGPKSGAPASDARPGDPGSRPVLPNFPFPKKI